MIQLVPFLFVGLFVAACTVTFFRAFGRVSYWRVFTVWVTASLLMSGLKTLGLTWAPAFSAPLSAVIIAITGRVNVWLLLPVLILAELVVMAIGYLALSSVG